MNDLNKFDQLLGRYLDGQATALESAELSAMLLTDPRNARRASELSLLHRQVSELMAEAQLHAMMDQYMDSRSTVGTASFGRETRARNATDRRWGWPQLAVAAAALVLLTVYFTRPHWRPPAAQFVDAQILNPPNSPPHAESAATLTQLVDAVWSPGGTRFVPGSQLERQSRIKLEAGMAKITFECGAEVVIQGPCDFVVRDEMVGLLHRGTLTANVPRRAFAFAILSPDVDFIDLGTSFGLSVDEAGKSELHVFEGEVLYNASRDTGRRPPAVHVTQKQAVGFEGKGQSKSIDLDEGKFARLLQLRKATAPHEAPVADAQLALWLSADTGVSMDQENRVVAWQDAVTSTNRSGEDATQKDPEAQPIWVADGIHSRPAVRFDGSSDYMITTPLETTDDQTVLIVVQFSEAAFDESRQWGGQILNYDGPPSREASDTFAPGILQIGEPLLASEFRPSLISGQVFAGFIGSAVVESGRVDTVALGANEPAIVCYRYDYHGGKSLLAINGEVLGEARAFAPQALTSRKIIGRHAWKDLFFAGELGELLVYNEALNEEQVQEVTRYLAEKFSIRLRDSAESAANR